MSATQPADLSTHEQELRRRAFRDALVQVRLEGLEPNPVFFEYAERYAQGEITIDEAIADFIARIKGQASAAPNIK